MPTRRLLATAACAFVVLSGARAQPAAFTARPYNTPGDGAVNTWVLLGPDSTAVIDCQRTPAEANAVAAAVRAAGRPVEAIVLTHEHADHTAGLQAMAAAFPDAPIVASAATAAAMAASTSWLLPLLQRVFGANAPTALPAPTRMIADGATLRLAGRDWRVDEHGPGEAASMTTLYSAADRLLIASDLIGNRVTPYLLDAQTGLWLAQLGRARTRYPAETVALCGHGTPAPFGLLATEQAEYLETFRGWVREALGSAPRLDDAGRAAITARHAARFGGFPRVVGFPDLVAQNADAVARELRA